MHWRKKHGEREDLRSHVEQHAIGLSVSEALALGISLAERAAGSEGVLRSAGFKVVRWRNFDVTSKTTARRASRCAMEYLLIYTQTRLKSFVLTGKD